MDRRSMLQLGALASMGGFLPNFSTASPQTIWDTKNVPGSLRLNANENAYGPSESAKKAVEASLFQANRYPIVSALPNLKTAIAQYHKVDEDMVLITAGSYQALRIIGTRLSNGTGNHIAPDLSFTALMRQSELMGCKWKKVPVKKDKSVDLAGMKSAIDKETQFVYLTNPNNPTGHFIDKETTEKFCREVAQTHPLVLDEAYIEFVAENESASLMNLVHELPNLIVVRTFSKIYGLAGLRIGYVITKPEWIKEWSDWNQTGGLGVSNVAAEAAIACLQDQRFVNDSREKIARTRNQFVQDLEALGITSVPSSTNFILSKTASIDQQLIPLLEKEKIDIGIGRQGAMAGLARITIGTPEQMNRLLNLIKSVV